MLNIDDRFVYIISLIPFCLVWAIFYVKRRDLRNEMLCTSIIIGILSVLTSYFWWTKDWWRPMTITNTIVGVEDIIMGFVTGGIMSVVYNIFSRKVYRGGKIKVLRLAGILVIALMACFTILLFVFVGLTSFWSSVVAMLLAILFMGYLRKDLILDSLLSGVLMLTLSFLFYGFIIFLSDTWISNTYLSGLSGISIFTVPVEEFIFWFLAGMWVGPFYEYSTGKKFDKREDIKKRETNREISREMKNIR